MDLMPSTIRGKIRVAVGLVVLYALQATAILYHSDSDPWFYSLFVTLGMICFVADEITKAYEAQLEAEINSITPDL